MDLPIPDPQFSELLSSELAIRIGWVCLHSFWQGGLVAAILAIALRVIPRRSTAEINARYLLATAALVALPLLATITFFQIRPEPISTDLAGFGSPTTPLPTDGVSKSIPLWDGIVESLIGRVGPLSLHPIEPWLPAVTLLWCVGATLAGLRMFAGWGLTRRLVSRAKVPTEHRWQSSVSRWCDDLGIDKPIRMLVSDAIDSPVLVGWLQPVILWPATALTGMTPQDIEAIIAHELAHIRRGDLGINLLQASIEVLFFHHPVVWWVSSQIRAEREHCVDDLAVRMLQSNAMGTRLSYARALLALEERRSIPTLSMAARGGTLLDRVRRLAGTHAPDHSPARPIAGGLVMAALLVILMAGVLASKPSQAIGLRSDMTQTFDFPRPEFVADRTPTPPTPQPPIDPNIASVPIAEAIVNRLTNARIPTGSIETLQADMLQAIEAGKPWTLQQVHSRLGELGVDWQILHAPPADRVAQAETHNSQTIFDPNVVNEPIAKAVVARLANARVDPAIMSAIRDAMWEAIRAGKPLSLEQLHARIESLGISAQTLHQPPAETAP
jgi:beta-lactamase regulating signal transducer with metallopeptidase domain